MNDRDARGDKQPDDILPLIRDLQAHRQRHAQALRKIEDALQSIERILAEDRASPGADTPRPRKPRRPPRRSA